MTNVASCVKHHSHGGVSVLLLSRDYSFETPPTPRGRMQSVEQQFGLPTSCVKHHSLGGGWGSIKRLTRVVYHSTRKKGSPSMIFDWGRTLVPESPLL